MTYQEIAQKLSIDSKQLEKESIEIFLKQKLRSIEAEIFKIISKYGIKDILEMDKMIKTGKIHEENSWENFFQLDNLESERDKIIQLLNEL